MANEEFTGHFARPAPVANDEGRRTTSTSIPAHAMAAREDGRDTSVAVTLSRPPNSGIPDGIPETSASGRRLVAAHPQDAAMPPGLSGTRTDLPAILRKNNGDFRTAMQHWRELLHENPDKRDREASALPDLGARGIKRPREIEHPGDANRSVTRRQIGLGREIDTVAASSLVNRDTWVAHSSNGQGGPQAGVYNVQPSADRAPETSQESSTLPDATSVSALYSGPPSEWFGRDTGYETDRNSGDTISAPIRGLEELEDSADSRYFGHEAPSLSENVTTSISNAEASSHSEHTEILDDVSSARSGEQGRGGDGGAILGFSHDLSPHPQRLPQTTPDDFPELTNAAMAEIDAIFESLSQKSLARESAAPGLHEPVSGDAFQKEGTSDRADGMPSNGEPPVEQAGGHLPQALRSSGAELDDFSWLTDAALAEIDALIKSHSNRSPSVRNAAPDLRGAGLDNAVGKDSVIEHAEKISIDSPRPARLNGERSPKAQKSSQASLADFPDLTDAEWSHIEETERIAITAIEKGKQKISTKADTRSGFGNSSVPQVANRSGTPMVPNTNQPIPLWYHKAENISDGLVEDTHITPAVVSSRRRNDAENASTRFGDPAPALRHYNLGRTLEATPVRDVISGTSRDRGLTAHAADQLAIDDSRKRTDRDRKTQPYIRGLDSRSREGYGR
ncbi:MULTISPECIES: protein virD3 [Rhizobium]|uniref:Protein virD3 n=1 Tax=Rhizobium tumorigenes TaxID=2041385 RepID=A0AAF1KTM1_9HYPH|nr:MULTISPECIES: protein virD3 [Rhizobium]MBO9102323.1 protein virD3 [Rhizobium sp. L58/93]MBO9172375.1 protein virD3 [Rhizobium sp. L245/93]MBO9188167.1 protein virD3 [Rhizobium sp. E27B/91]QXZ87656.1 protein virD3 [Rhizobium sp. K1/93]QXZ93697.1 protein virD3 [Rhizobium sp. K15/93]